MLDIIISLHSYLYMIVITDYKIVGININIYYYNFTCNN